MRTGLCLFAAGVCALAADAQPPAPKPALPPLSVKGTSFVDPAGKPVLLRGVNLGSWLLMETHFTGLPFKDEKSLAAGLEKRFGKAKAAELRDAYRAAWVAEDDFRRVKELGLNHVRVPFWYALLESDARPGAYSEEGWKWLDRAVDWSEKAGLYCVLDLHGVPGGQSKEDHAGEKDRNAYWADPAARKRAANLWAAVAKRYKGRPAVAAFDLLNEPMGAPSGPAAVAAQAELMRAVHQADPKRVVVIEDGYKGANHFPRLAGADRSRVAYSAHFYPTMKADEPSPQLHEEYIRDKYPLFQREQARFGQPFYVGEWSVIQEKAGGGPMSRRHVEAMERNGWSWALWLYKQANKAPVSGCWSFYRNSKPIDMPDLDADDAETIARKFGLFRTENMVLYEPLRDAVK